MTETEEINASMQRITDEAEKRRAADPDYDKKIEEARLERDRSDHRSKVYMAQNGWNAPERHLKTKVTESGPWFAKFQAIDAKLGSGFLVALVGERGNGKTQMAVNLMKSTTWSLRTARFMTAVEFFMRIKGTFRKGADDDEADVIRDLSKPSLLVIDEIGKRSESEWENTILFELINRRYNAMRDTLIIDNRPAQEFTEMIGPSLASRMHETGGIITCDWPSFRS